MASSYSDGPQYRSFRGSAQDFYEPERQSVPGTVDRDGYATRDGFQPSEDLSTHPSALSRGHSQRGLGEGSYGGPGSEKVPGGSVANRSGRGSSRNRSHHELQRYDNRYDGDYDSDSSDDSESHRRSRGPVSKIKRRLSQVFTQNQDDRHSHSDGDGESNTEMKKWGATLAGAMVGGFAARKTKKDHWVPVALGAMIGGITAREAEKIYYRRKDDKEKEREAWEGRRRSRSIGY